MTGFEQSVHAQVATIGHARDHMDTTKRPIGRRCQARGGGDSTSRSAVTARNTTPSGADTTGVVSSNRHDDSNVSCTMPEQPTTHGHEPDAGA